VPSLRRDAARNRDLILGAARELGASGEPLQLNAVARRAEVGIGTVYRHFPSPEALAEALVAPRFVELIEIARQKLDDPDAGRALREFLAEALQVFVEDPAFAAAAVSATSVRTETDMLRGELVGQFAALARRAEAHLRPGLDAMDLMILVCGLGYSVRLRPEKAAAYFEAMLGELVPAS